MKVDDKKFTSTDKSALQLLNVLTFTSLCERRTQFSTLFYVFSTIIYLITLP